MKSNKKNRYTPLCVAAFSMLALFAACDRNEMEPEQKTEGPETAYVELDQIGVEGSVLSRATVVPTTGEIGFFLKAANGYQIGANHVKGTWKESAVTQKNAWIPDPMIKVGTADATMAIYYPYDKQQARMGKRIYMYPGELGGSFDDNIAPDEIVCERWYKQFEYNSLSSYEKDFSVVLDQLYSKLKITLKRGTDFVGTPEWSKVRLLGSNVSDIAMYAYYNVFRNEVDNSLRIEDYTRTNTGATGREIVLKSPITLSGDESTPVEILLIPNNLSGKLTLTITLGGKEMPVIIDTTTQAGFNNKLEPGKQYNLTITVNSTDLEVASLQTAAWDTVDMPDQSTN